MIQLCEKTEVKEKAINLTSVLYGCEGYSIISKSLLKTLKTAPQSFSYTHDGQYCRNIEDRIVFLRYGGTTCNATWQLSRPPITGNHGWWMCGPLTINAPYSWKGLMKWQKFIFNKKISPWRDLLNHPAFKALWVNTPYGLFPFGFKIEAEKLLDNPVEVGLVRNFAIAVRNYGEKYFRVAAFSRLMEEKGPEDIYNVEDVFLAASCVFCFNPEDGMTWYILSGHEYFNQTRVTLEPYYDKTCLRKPGTIESTNIYNVGVADGRKGPFNDRWDLGETNLFKYWRADSTALGGKVSIQKAKDLLNKLAEFRLERRKEQV